MTNSSNFGGRYVSVIAEDNFDIFKTMKDTVEFDSKNQINLLLERLNDLITINTAVWEGETLVNWSWSVGTPNLIHRQPIGAGDPGHTSTMALGSEPRRPANQAIVDRSLQAILALKKIPPVIYLTNVGEVATEMEYGMVPTAERSRTPNGMLRLATRTASLWKF